MFAVRYGFCEKLLLENMRCAKLQLLYLPEYKTRIFFLIKYLKNVTLCYNRTQAYTCSV